MSAEYGEDRPGRRRLERRLARKLLLLQARSGGLRVGEIELDQVDLGVELLLELERLHRDVGGAIELVVLQRPVEIREPRVEGRCQASRDGLVSRGYRVDLVDGVGCIGQIRERRALACLRGQVVADRKSTRLNSSHIPL